MLLDYFRIRKGLQTLILDFIEIHDLAVRYYSIMSFIELQKISYLHLLNLKKLPADIAGSHLHRFNILFRSSRFIDF